MSSTVFHFIMCREFLHKSCPWNHRAKALLLLNTVSFWMWPSSVLPTAATDAKEQTQNGWMSCWEQHQRSATGSIYIQRQWWKDKTWYEIYLNHVLSGSRSQKIWFLLCLFLLNLLVFIRTNSSERNMAHLWGLVMSEKHIRTSCSFSSVFLKRKLRGGHCCEGLTCWEGLRIWSAFQII